METGVKGFFDLTDGSYGITFRVHYSQTYDIDTNKSVVAISQIQVKGSVYYGFTHYLDGTIKIDGKTAVEASSYNGTNSVSVGKKDTFANVGGKLGSVTVAHDDDGTKSVTIVVSMKGVHPTSGTKWSVSGSKTVELTEIPRASVLTVENGTLGTSQVITAVKKKETFSHSITYTCGSVSGTICTKSQEESFEFTPPIELASQHTTGTSVLVKFTLQTYSGDTAIASPVSVAVTMAIPDFVKPCCFLTITDATGYRDVFGGYVQGQSKLSVSISGEMAYGSEIDAYRAEANGDIYTSQSFVTGAIRGSGEQTVTATVTDRRGRTSEAAVATINVLEYFAPSISQLSVHRCNEDGTENSKGSFAKVTYSHTITSLSELNEKTVTLKYKKSANYAYTTVELEPVYVSENASYIFASDDGSSYDVILIVSDSFTGETPTQKITSISTADVVMHWRADAKGLGFGKVSEKANALDMDWNIELNGNNVYQNGKPAFAPAGYGLGTGSVAIDDLNAFLANGWGWIGEDTKNAPSGLKYASVHVTTRLNNQIVQTLTGINQNRGCQIVRTSLDGGSAWIDEYVNPPMLINAEYRTTERWGGKPVYVKRISFGALPASGSSHVSTGINGGTLVSLTGTFYFSGGGAEPYPVMGGSGPKCLAWVSDDCSYLYTQAIIDCSEYTGEFIIKYTKD